jgi:hypothetical protein
MGFYRLGNRHEKVLSIETRESHAMFVESYLDIAPRMWFMPQPHQIACFFQFLETMYSPCRRLIIPLRHHENSFGLQYKRLLCMTVRVPTEQMRAPQIMDPFFPFLEHPASAK